MEQGSSPSAAVLKLSFTPLCPCLSEETLKAVGPFYLVSMPHEKRHAGNWRKPATDSLTWKENS